MKSRTLTTASPHSKELIAEAAALFSAIATGKVTALRVGHYLFAGNPELLPDGADHFASGVIPSNAITIVAKTGHVITMYGEPDAPQDIAYATLSGIRFPSGEILNPESFPSLTAIISNPVGSLATWYQAEESMLPFAVRENMSNAIYGAHGARATLDFGETGENGAHFVARLNELRSRPSPKSRDESRALRDDVTTEVEKMGGSTLSAIVLRETADEFLAGHLDQAALQQRVAEHRHAPLPEIGARLEVLREWHKNAPASERAHIEQKAVDIVKSLGVRDMIGIPLRVAAKEFVQGKIESALLLQRTKEHSRATSLAHASTRAQGRGIER